MGASLACELAHHILIVCVRCVTDTTHTVHIATLLVLGVKVMIMVIVLRLTLHSQGSEASGLEAVFLRRRFLPGKTSAERLWFLAGR